MLYKKEAIFVYKRFYKVKSNNLMFFKDLLADKNNHIMYKKKASRFSSATYSVKNVPLVSPQ